MPASPSHTDIEIVPLTTDDVPVLWEMLHLASLLEDRTREQIRADPDLARYVEGWGRAGDSGVKAVDRDPDACVGAAWLRLWTAEDHGYGYIDARTPELSIAVVPRYQGQGIGRRLLEELIAVSRGTHAAVSLSVRRTNPAQRLYRRVGFMPVDGSDGTDPADSSMTMRLDLSGATATPPRW